jgi:hypothetical protein
MLRGGRRIPGDRAAWLEALARSHQVIAARPSFAATGFPKTG